MITNNCAFIRQSWYDTARKHMNDAERLQFYEMCFDLEFTNNEPIESSSAIVQMLFDIARPIIEQDKEKAQRKRETARANGMNGGRPKQEINNNTHQLTKPSGLNENPVGFFGLANTMYNNTNTTTNNNVCVQATEMNRDTKFFVCVEFFLQGVENPIEEGKLFWNYYDARGWRTGDGQEIKNIIALSRSWHPKNLSMKLAKGRAELKGFFEKIEYPDYSVFDHVKGCRVFDQEKKVVIYVNKKDDAEYLEERHINSLSKWIKDPENRGEDWALEYSIAQDI